MPAQRNPADLGLAILSGRVSPPWAARAARVQRLLAGVLGDGGPSLPPEPLAVAARPAKLAKMRPFAAGRPVAVQAATDAFDALVMRRWKRLPDTLASSVVVLWPDGTIARHGRDALLDALEKRPGKPAPVQMATPKSYTFSELKHALARGVPEALDAVLGLREGLTVTLTVDSIRGPIGRVMLHAAPEDDGTWRTRTLIFGSPDDAHALSTAPSKVEDDPEKSVDQLVRRIVLGQSAEILSLRNLATERLWVRGELMTFDDLAKLTGKGDTRLDAAELVFQGSKEAPLSKLDKLAKPGGLARIKKAAPDLFGRAFERLDPRVVVTTIGLLDPASGEVAPSTEAASLVLKLEDPATRTARRRIAAIFY